MQISDRTSECQDHRRNRRGRRIRPASVEGIGARAGHTVYASMRETTGRHATEVAKTKAFVVQDGTDLHTIELNVASQQSADSAITQIIADIGRLDVIVHNAGCVSYGPAEAFTPEQLPEHYDTNAVSTQWVNRAALPQLRKQGQGLAVWILSAGARGGASGCWRPTLPPKRRQTRWQSAMQSNWRNGGVPGLISKTSSHYIHSGRLADRITAEEYADGPTADVSEMALKGFATLKQMAADPQELTDAIVRIVNAPFRQRPFRIHVDPSADGAEVVNGIADRVRADLLRRIGLADLLNPTFIP